MDFIYEKHIAGLQGSKQTCQISRLIQHRTRRNLHIHPHFVGDNVRESGFTQTGRAVEEGMIKRLTPKLCRLDIDMQVGHDFTLAREIFKVLRADNSVQILIFVFDIAVRVEI